MVPAVPRVATRYENLDKLISAVNADGRVNVFYSTPAQYVAAKQKETDVVWPLFDGNNADFFPCVAYRISRSKATLKLIRGRRAAESVVLTATPTASTNSGRATSHRALHSSGAP